jgi:tyrocidine synthetase III
MNNNSHSGINYWIENLNDANELNLPGGAYVNDTDASFVEIPLTMEDLSSIRAIAGGKDLNVLKLFLTAAGIVLWKYSSQNEAVISLSPLLLPDIDIEKSGTLYCKLKLEKEITVSALLAHVHTVLNDAYLNCGYDETEFKKVYATKKNGSLAVLEGVAFHYNKLSAPGAGLDGHKILFELKEAEQSYLRVHSRTALYPLAMLKKMGEAILSLVLALPENKNKILGACEIVAEQERASWEKRFLLNQRSYPTEFTVIDLFDKAVKADPGKTALMYGNKATTYGELDRESKRIAAIVAGLLPDNNIERLAGVMMDRSGLLVASVIAILRTGAAYLPFDKEYPKERISDILLDSGCSVIITDSDEYPEIAGCTFVNISKANSEIITAEYTVPAPSDLAYVIYSSGTTGKPKGIMVEHAAISNLLYFYNERYGISENTRIVQITNIVIDIAFQEIFSALINGLTLYIPSLEESRDKDLFISYLDTNKINFMQLIPDMLSEYLLNTPKLEHLDQILCGGDKLSDTLKDAIVSKGYTLFNVYGQTETAIDTVGAVCINGVPMKFNEYVPNYDVFILDECGHLSPEFVPGEIYTGGAGLARGYLNKRELTEEKFCNHPFKKGERIYRTGDLGRRFPDGSIELLGRKDDQIKIRGYRIELSEIENALESHPEIDAAVVTVHEKNGEKELVAYIVSDSAQNASVMRSYLAKIKPAYMLPTYFIQMERFPINSGGKVDRKKLPAPDNAYMRTDAVYVAPRDERERVIAGIWEALLGKERIGIEDDFFELGGDSIKILRLMSELRKQLNLKVSFADIYKNNTITKLIDHISHNSDEINRHLSQREALKSLINKEIEELKESVLLTISETERNAIEDIYPMSDIEKGMIYESLADEGSGVYHDIEVHRREFANFNIEKFRQALQLLTAKHSILRTSFNLDDYDKEIQIVHKEIMVEVGDVSVSGQTKEEQENTIREFIRSEFKRPFVFSSAPLWRMDVFRLSANEIMLVTQCHHAIIDGWSDASFMTELNNLYLKLLENSCYNPGQLRSNYRDFVVEHELDKRDEKIKNFWQKELSGFTKLDLFADDDKYEAFTFVMDAAMLKKIEQLALHLNTSVKTISLAVYLYMLKVLNYENEVLIGLVANTRPDCDDSDRILGCFLNTIPLRLIIDGNMSCADFIMLVHHKLAELKQYERFSMLEISKLHDKQLQKGNAFFDVIFNYIDFHVYNSLENTAGQLNAQVKEKINIEGKGFTNTYLDFDADKTAGRFTISMRLRKKLKSGFDAQQTCSLYYRIMNQMTSLCVDSIKEISCIAEEEKHALLTALDNTKVAYPRNSTIISLFEEQVEKNPDRTALVSGKVELSYKELNEKANIIAGYLQKNYAVKPDDLVGLKLERTEVMIISILGILKSGAAYVPVDPAYPAERIAYMLADSNSKVVIDEDELRRIKDNEKEYSTANPSLANKPGDLAYVIYTSGTTGKPKGTLIEHKNVVRLFKTDQPLFDFSSADVWSMFHSYCFDFSVWEMYGALLSGGMLVMVPAETAKDPAEYLQLINERKVTVLNQTPSAFYNLQEEAVKPNAPEASSIRYIIFGGEALSPQKLRKWNTRYPAAKLVNMYGITETTVHVTYKEITSKEIDKGISNIGVPIPTLSCYVLGEGLGLLPVGIEGELYVGGDGLARGYLNNETLTKERFIKHPFRENERLYKSGDRVRLLPGGEMEYFGRKDGQIKIRGHRVELTEIENVLMENSAIKEAVVIVKKDKAGEQNVIAYIVSDTALSVTGIRTQLSAQLPQYMLPGYYVQIDKLPLTLNGKLDKNKLPDPGDLGVPTGKEYVAPHNEIQSKLIKIWKEVLNKEQIGILDDFFELGGHSLTITRLVAKIHKAFDVKPALKDLFVNAVLKDQAALIQNTKETAFVEIKPLPVQDYYPMSSSQRLFWLASQFEEATIAYNIPGVCIFEGEINSAALIMSLGSILKRHESLRTVFKANPQGEISQYIMPEELSAIAFSTTDLRGNKNRNEKINAVVQEESNKPFDLASGPLIRFCLFRMEDKRWIFTYTMHHIISDGWSMSVLLDELFLLYNSTIKGEKNPLPALRIQYRDYVSWQQEQLSGSSFKRHREYWLKQFDGDLPLLNLAGSKTRPALKTYNGKTVKKEIDKKITKELKALTQKEGTTLFMNLLACVNVLLYKYSNQEDIIIGTSIAGREHADLENQIGYYLNTLALRTTFKDTNTFSELLQNVKNVTLEAYEHQIYPFDDLVEELSIVRDLSRNVLFDVFIVLQNTKIAGAKQRPVPDGLVITEFKNVEHQFSKFDLTFDFNETEDGLVLSLEYNTDLFDEIIINRMTDHFEKLLAGSIRQPGITVRQLAYLTNGKEQEETVILDNTEFNSALSDDF